MSDPRCVSRSCLFCSVSCTARGKGETPLERATRSRLLVPLPHTRPRSPPRPRAHAAPRRPRRPLGSPAARPPAPRPAPRAPQQPHHARRPLALGARPLDDGAQRRARRGAAVRAAQKARSGAGQEARSVVGRWSARRPCGVRRCPGGARLGGREGGRRARERARRWCTRGRDGGAARAARRRRRGGLGGREQPGALSGRLTPSPPACAPSCSLLYLLQRTTSHCYLCARCAPCRAGPRLDDAALARPDARRRARRRTRLPRARARSRCSMVRSLLPLLVLVQNSTLTPCTSLAASASRSSRSTSASSSSSSRPSPSPSPRPVPRPQHRPRPRPTCASPPQASGTTSCSRSARSPSRIRAARSAGGRGVRSACGSR
mgnify:CR=1 FL=1